MYRTIVFGTDGSPTAAIAEEAAIELATRYEARIVAVSAFEPPGTTPEAARDVAGRAVEAAGARNVEATAWVQRGEPADVVLQTADREQADLVVVGNKGMGQATRFRLGSVPDRVAHYANCDVLIVATSGPGATTRAARRRYRKVVAATDGSPTANEAVRKAFELAMIHRASVLLVHVGDPIVGTIRMETVARSRPDRVEVDLRALEGDPAEQICDLAERENADLVVVGNKGMSGTRRYLLGSVPNRVAHASPTDVLIVRTVDLSVFDIQPEHGAVVEMGGRRMAVYRDPESVVHAVSARCTHMGCTVGWNDGDKTWDCPCHGSRYDRFGHVIRGPAKADLEGAPVVAVPAAERVATEPARAPVAPGHADETFVVVGASLTGASAVVKLRTEGFRGRLVLIGEENHYPYERPPLSKAFLRGEVAFEEALVQPVGFYRDNQVEVRFATRATALDPEARTVTLDSGDRVRFDRCLIATGARNRRVPIPGLDLPAVYQLRSLGDAERIRAEITPGRRVVIVGMGFIGSEVAASLRQRGLDVIALERSLPLARVLGEQIGSVIAEVHRQRGVDLRLGDGVAAFEGDGRVREVVTTNGLRVECDFVVAGLGVEPNVELGAEAGLSVEDGIVVDEFCRTSAEAVYAAGDVASHFHPLFGRHIRIEHWQNAIRHGEAAALNMLGRKTEYREVPWFWSDQYEHNFQYAGYHMDWDELVIRGSTDDRSFVAFYVKDGRVKSVLAMNQGAAVPDATELIRAGVPVEASSLSVPGLEPSA